LPESLSRPLTGVAPLAETGFSSGVGGSVFSPQRGLTSRRAGGPMRYMSVRACRRPTLCPSRRGCLPSFAGSVVRGLKIQFIEPPHQPQIPLRHQPQLTVHARARQIQRLRLLHTLTTANLQRRTGQGNGTTSPGQKSTLTRVRSRSHLSLPSLRGYRGVAHRSSDAPGCPFVARCLSYRWAVWMMVEPGRFKVRKLECGTRP
jgi:hypothetical protein